MADVRPELAFGADPAGDPNAWTWTDVSSDLLDQSIQINRGRSDEMSQVQPQTTSLVLDNRSGDYTPRNPASSYFPHVSLGVPIRLRTGDPDARLYQPIVDNGQPYAGTPDVAALHITGDMDVRMEITPNSWRPPAGYTALAGRYLTPSDQRSWAFLLESSGALKLWWSPTGTLASLLSATSTAAVPSTSGRLAVRVTIDVNNGSGGRTITFFTAPSMAGPWTQLGSPVTQSGTTSIFAGTAGLGVGATSDIGGIPFGGGTAFRGFIHAMELRSGIAGTVVAAPDFTIQEPGVRSFTDSAGRVWAPHSDAVVIDPGVRFSGQVASWEPIWPYGDISSADDPGESRVSITGAGILRRLQQGAQPLQSAAFRGIMSPKRTAPIVYWPCEDGSGATECASAIEGVPPLYVLGDVAMATNTDFASSKPLPAIRIGQLTSHLISVPYTSTGIIVGTELVSVPPEGIPGDPVLLMALVGWGTAQEFRVMLESPGNLRLRIFDRNGTEIYTGSLIAFNMLGAQRLLELSITQSGADIIWTMRTYDADAVQIGGVTQTLAGRTFEPLNRVTIGGGGPDMGGIAVGHVSVQTYPVDFILYSSMRAWLGETATKRILRLAEEEGVPLRIDGDRSASEGMGPQTIDTFVNLLRAAETADGGILFEERSFPGLVYRPRQSLYNQDPGLSLHAAALPGKPYGDIQNPFTPVDDDQAARNDITASRPSGSSFRLSDDDDIVSRGRYSDDLEVNVAADTQLPDVAGWALHLGTWPEMRYPHVSPDFVANPDLIIPWNDLDVGDLITVDGLPPQHPPGAVLSIMQGYSETLMSHTQSTELNTSPGGPWTTIGQATGQATVLPIPERVDTAGSVLAAAIDADDTSLSVTTTQGPPWITSAVYASEFPLGIEIDGEEMTVTAITGTSSPQTFTVTRSANGIVKPHAAGSDVSLAAQAFAAR